MGSNRKKKTTFAKLNREQKLRERRVDKAARKRSRREIAADNQDAVASTAPRDAV